MNSEKKAQNLGLRSVLPKAHRSELLVAFPELLLVELDVQIQSLHQVALVLHNFALFILALLVSNPLEPADVVDPRQHHQDQHEQLRSDVTPGIAHGHQ